VAGSTPIRSQAVLCLHRTAPKSVGTQHAPAWFMQCSPSPPSFSSLIGAHVLLSSLCFPLSTQLAPFSGYNLRRIPLKSPLRPVGLRSAAQICIAFYRQLLHIFSIFASFRLSDSFTFPHTPPCPDSTLIASRLVSVGSSSAPLSILHTSTHHQSQTSLPIDSHILKQTICTSPSNACSCFTAGCYPLCLFSDRHLTSDKLS
jgi:hypothetical protein